MNRRYIFSTFFVAAMFVVSVASQALAGTISLSGSGAGGTRAIGSGAGDDGLNVTSGLYDPVFCPTGCLQDNFAGRTIAEVTDFTGIDLLTQALFDAYCVDLGAAVEVPGTYTFTDDPMSTWSLGGDGTDGREAAYLYNTYAGLVSNGAERAGLQLAIWEVLQDDVFDLTDGHLRVTSADAAAIAYANSIGSNLLSDAAWLRLTGVNALGGPIDVQDFSGPTSTPVPEPATVLLLGSGLAAAARSRWAKRRRG